MALRVWLPLNGSVENKGIGDITFTNQATSGFSDNGKIGKCLNTLNSYYYFTVPQLVNATTFSCCFWYKQNGSSSLTTNWRRILDFTTQRSGESNGLLRFESSYGIANYAISVHSNASYQVCPSTVGNKSLAQQPDTWYHIAMTLDGSMITFYVNGEVFNSGAQTTGSLTGAVSICETGSQADGWLNDLRIYDHCLSAKEVKEISQGLVLHYKLDELSQGSGNNLVTGLTKGGQTTVVGDTIVTSGQNSDTYFKIVLSSALELNKSYTMGIDAENLPDGGYFRFPIGSQSNSSAGYIDIYNGHNESVFIANDVIVNCGTSLMMDDNTRTAWPNQCIFKNFYIYENTSIADSSGYGNDGTILSDPYTNSDADRYQISTHFDGIDDGILIENLTLSPIINDQITYSFWIKPESENGGRSVYFGSYSSTSWSVEKTTGNVLRLYWNGSPDETCSGATITDGTWQHIVITKNGANNIKVYINGVQKWSSTAAHNTLSFPTTYRIGRDTRTGDGTPYHGLMSDFRIYSTALSAEDILDLYHTSANIDDLGNLHGFEFIEDESKQSIYKNGQIATKYELQNNLWSGTQINVSNMAVTYNYQTDVFRNYGFDTCMKFTSTHIADGTSWYGYSYICDNTIVHNLAETYTFSMYAYVSTDCNANFRVHTEHANSWVSNYQGTTANINDMTKGQVIKVWGKAKTNASDGKIYLMFYFNPHLVDTFTTGYILVAGLNVVIGDTIYPPGIMPMNGFNQDKNISSINNDLIIMNDFIEK